ncbi:MAG: hypothetical protein WBD96_17340, partial [Pseudolabrys sp.]
GADRDRNGFALRVFYDRQTIKFDFGHHALLTGAYGKYGHVADIGERPARGESKLGPNVGPKL